MKSNAYTKPFATALPSYAGNACEVKSGIAVQVQAELYTSAAGSRCKQLSRLRQQGKIQTKGL